MPYHAHALPSGSTDPKAVLKAALLAHLEAAALAARAAHQSAIEGATHSEAKAENDKDTRGPEQSYPARGQAQRVAELERAIAEVTVLALRSFPAGTAVAISALVTVVDDTDATRQFFLTPHGGGLELPGGVTALTLSSPIARALLGRQLGDDCEIRVGGVARSCTITGLS